MTQKIVRLSEEVINQIAAGEVVENPASIVKELIENSIDAQAHRIDIRIQGGGFSLIEIEDDGCGMSPEDALLSLERHATSKIRSAGDLQSLKTMGFRGEALAAIAAVSHFELKTSEKEAGTAIVCQGGKVEAITPIARNQGTTISIRSLFFNVPARKKFQKSIAANTAQIKKIVEAIAIAHPEIAFSLKSGQEKLLTVEIEDQKQRAQTLLGSFSHEVRTPSLFALLSTPSEAKNHRRDQLIFINRRLVFSPLISRAVQMGYGTRLSEHSYPPFVLFLDIDPSQVDVNVHPQKKEVRIHSESTLFQTIQSSIASAFEASSFTSSLMFDESPRFENIFPKEERFSYSPYNQEMKNSFQWAEERTPFPLLQEAPLSLPFEIEERALIVVDGYLLIEKEGLILIDLKAAHARILFEDLKQETKASQPLLWPLEIAVDDLEEVTDLEKWGIECRWMGPKQLAIDSLPQGIEPSDFPSFFALWKEGKNIDRTIARFCRGLKKRYSLDEAFLLWRRLQKCLDPLYDPLGKRIWKQLKEADLEQWIHRG